eukprot:SM000090S24291  [mRNA]  locus=s90:96990:100534:+ [translate_table: standard]
MARLMKWHISLTWSTNTSRIVLPFTLEEYRVAQLYMVAKYSAKESESDDGDGVEFLKNEPYEDEKRKGQYTHKYYHLASKLPSWIATIIPQKALMLEEEAWNAYPYCRTVYASPFFTKFSLTIESFHVEDRGTTENALNMDADHLKMRQVEIIDIAMDPVDKYIPEEDPSKFKSKKNGRGPLMEGWMQKCEPKLCAYKVVSVDVPYWGWGSRLEKYIATKAERKVFTDGHRKSFCWMDEWIDLTMVDIRKMELETATNLREKRANGKVSTPGSQQQPPLANQTSLPKGLVSEDPKQPKTTTGFFSYLSTSKKSPQSPKIQSPKASLPREEVTAGNIPQQPRAPPSNATTFSTEGDAVSKEYQALHESVHGRGSLRANASFESLSAVAGSKAGHYSHSTTDIAGLAGGSPLLMQTPPRTPRKHAEANDYTAGSDEKPVDHYVGVIDKAIHKLKSPGQSPSPSH